MDGSLIMSAHYNKQIHVTDIRAPKDEKQVISLSGRPTSIAVPEDFSQSLLALTRNNDLAVIDLRQMTVRISLTDFENDFRVTADYSRCSLSVSVSSLHFGNIFYSHVGDWHSPQVRMGESLAGM